MAKSTQEQLDEVRLEREALELEDLRERVHVMRDRKARAAMDRERAVAEFKKSEQIIKARQARCKHRKGGLNNKFAEGNSANYSIITNTYPTGRVVISCTRCWKQVERPDPRTKKSDPDYAEKLAQWQEWSRYPTDNTPSGTKTHEITANVA